jgi:hypothetical protein
MSAGTERIDSLFDGHPVRDFASMTAEERIEDLEAKVALVLELRQARLPAAWPVSERHRD